ncbi:hypothetical protein GUI12_01270 [Anaplasmataceae bacterium AB001_6]|nr:hypothetical protein GUI12_01270 [Anaplasmataceae bacterium AB001_6]
MERNVSTIMKKIKCWLGCVKPAMEKDLEIQHRSAEEESTTNGIEAKDKTDAPKPAKKKSTATKKSK